MVKTKTEWILSCKIVQENRVPKSNMFQYGIADEIATEDPKATRYVMSHPTPHHLQKGINTLHNLSQFVRHSLQLPESSSALYLLYPVCFRKGSHNICAKMNDADRSPVLSRSKYLLDQPCTLFETVLWFFKLWISISSTSPLHLTDRPTGRCILWTCVDS